MPVACVANFVEALCQGSFLEAPQRDELTRELQLSFPEVGELTRELLRREWLTKYQAERLLNDKTNDLHIGPYLLIEPLGEGGMGQVFKARHKAQSRLVALKLLRPKLVNNPIALKRFLREMMSAAKLAHPNIVCCLDAAQHQDSYYYVMEHVAGRDISRLVRQDGLLKVPQACDYVRQAALGLQHAHDLGLVHRDIKPANLLVTTVLELLEPPPLGRWGVVKVVDLGLARVEDDEGSALTHMGVIMGTPDFIAPEQVRSSHSCDHRADIYGLGCTFYYMLTGKPPYQRETLAAKLIAHTTEEPEPVEKMRFQQQVARGAKASELKYMSSRVSTIVRKMMAKAPEDRYQSAREVADALSEILLSGQRGPSAANDAKSGGYEAELTDAPSPLQLSMPGQDSRAVSDLESSTGNYLAEQRADRKKWLLIAAASTVLLGFVLLAAFLAESWGTSPVKPTTNSRESKAGTTGQQEP